MNASPIKKTHILTMHIISSSRFARSPGGYGGGRYVDYGAYTGNKGAFGWYTDHPVGKY
jgi:hypothetical protein